MTQPPANNPSGATTQEVDAVASAPDIGCVLAVTSTDVESLLDELERLSDETDVWAGAADDAARAVGEVVAASSATASAATVEPNPVRERVALNAEPEDADSDEALRHLDSVLAQAAESLADGADADAAIAQAVEKQLAGAAEVSAGGAHAQAAADEAVATGSDGFSTVDDVVREVAETFDAGEAPAESSAPVGVAAPRQLPAVKPGGDPESSRLLIEKEGTRWGKASGESPSEATPALRESKARALGSLVAPLAVLAFPMKLISVGVRDTIGHLALVTMVCGGGVWYAVKYVPRESAPLAMSDLVVFKTQEDAPGHGAAKADDPGGGGKKASKDAHGKGDAHGKKPAEKKSGSSGHAKPAAKGGKDKKDAKGGGHQ